MLWIVLLNACFYVVLEVVLYIESVNLFVIHFGWSRDQNWVFGVKNGVKIVTACAKSYSDYLRLKMQFLTQKIVLRFSKSYSNLTESPVSRSCVFFTHFCFELAFGVNKKVVDNWVSFLMALVWLENDFYNLSYDGNSPSGSWRKL